WPSRTRVRAAGSRFSISGFWFLVSGFTSGAPMPTPKRRQRGFTLIELMVVVTIIGILAGVAVSNVKWAQQRARESALRHDLFEMRKAIDDYYADKQKYPESLAALKSEHYMRNIPKDPVTMRTDWEEVPAQADPAGSGSPDPNA